MTKVISEFAASGGPSADTRLDLVEKRERDLERPGVKLNVQAGESWEATLAPEERELLRDIVHDLRTIRYGSIVLVIHEGRLVEVSKTVKIRKTKASNSEKERIGK